MGIKQPKRSELAVHQNRPTGADEAGQKGESYDRERKSRY